MPREVIDSGEAFKTVYLSKAPAEWDADRLGLELEKHVTVMRKEVQQTGRLVRIVQKFPTGYGDVRIIMKWVKLGDKYSKKELDERHRARGQDGKGNQPGHPAPQKDVL